MDFFRRLFESDFMPHGHCYFWKPEVLWTNVIGDATIVLAYFTIPFALYYFISKRKDIRYPGIFILFALFIFSCGLTHLLDIISVWIPIYRFEGLLKLFTGIVSITTAAFLIKAIPDLLKLPTREAYEETNAVLRQKKAELRKQNEYLRNLAYATSHDLKEPARGVSIYAQALLSRNANQLNDEVREKLKYIASEGKRMYEMVESVMEFSFLESEEYFFEKVNLENVVHNAQMNIKLLVEENNARIEYDFLPEIIGNETILTIMFQNIITNSIKFKRHGINPVIKITSEETDTATKIIVTDNGVGFDNKYKELVFEMFKRLDANTIHKGSGLGLAICKRVIDIHHGTIEAFSEINKGTSIVITLPK
jgi:signal transduction histidine kinase